MITITSYNYLEIFSKWDVELDHIRRLITLTTDYIKAASTVLVKNNVSNLFKGPTNKFKSCQPFRFLLVLWTYKKFLRLNSCLPTVIGTFISWTSWSYKCTQFYNRLNWSLSPRCYITFIWIITIWQLYINKKESMKNLVFFRKKIFHRIAPWTAWLLEKPCLYASILANVLLIHFKASFKIVNIWKNFKYDLN